MAGRTGWLWTLLCLRSPPQACPHAVVFLSLCIATSRYQMFSCQVFDIALMSFETFSRVREAGRQYPAGSSAKAAWG